MGLVDRSSYSTLALRALRKYVFLGLAPSTGDILCIAHIHAGKILFRRRFSVLMYMHFNRFFNGRKVLKCNYELFTALLFCHTDYLCHLTITDRDMNLMS